MDVGDLVRIIDEGEIYSCLHAQSDYRELIRTNGLSYAADFLERHELVHLDCPSDWTGQIILKQSTFGVIPLAAKDRFNYLVKLSIPYPDGKSGYDIEFISIGGDGLELFTKNAPAPTITDVSIPPGYHLDSDGFLTNPENWKKRLI